MTFNKNLCIGLNSTIKDVILKMDQGGQGALFVVDNDLKLLGIITDGDVRRGLIKNLKLEDNIDLIVNRNCKFGNSAQPRAKNVIYAQRNFLRHYPIVNDQKVLVDIILLDEELNNKKTSEVFLMVGGLGSRLGQLTENLPKPMLPIKDKPILEHILNGLTGEGFREFTFCINYKGDVIKNYFKNGDSWGVKISYIEEKERMGTAGGLSLLSREPSNPFIVMNGDLLTNVNFVHFLSFHKENNADLTVGIKGYEVNIPFGVCVSEGIVIKEIAEKPKYVYNTSAGVYVMSPSCLSFLPPGEYFDMTDLIKILIREGKKVIGFPIHEDWLDIGHIGDYLRAKENK